MRKQNEETDAVQSRDRVTGETYVAEKAFATFCDSTPSNSGNHSHQTSHTTENDLKRCLKEEEITQKLQSAAKVINIFGMVLSIIIVVLGGLLGSFLLYSDSNALLPNNDSNLSMSFNRLGAIGMAIVNFVVWVFSALIQYFIFYVISLLLEAIARNLQYRKDISRLIEYQIRTEQIKR